MQTENRKTGSSFKVTRPEGGVWWARKTSGVLLCIRIKGVQTSFSAFCLGCGVGMGSCGGGGWIPPRYIDSCVELLENKYKIEKQQKLA